MLNYGGCKKIWCLWGFGSEGSQEKILITIFHLKKKILLIWLAILLYKLPLFKSIIICDPQNKLYTRKIKKE